MAYRKRGSSWLVDVTVNGKRRYRTVATEDLAKIAEKELELSGLRDLEGLTQGGANTAAPLPLAGAASATTSWSLQDGLTHCLGHRWKGTRSEAFYEATGGYLVKHFGATVPLASITTEAVDDYRSGMEKAGLGRSTINHRLVTLGVIFKEAIKRKAISGVTVKPELGIKQVRNGGRIRWVTEQEELLMLKLLDQWGKADVRDWVITLLDTGMRPSESQALQVHDISFKTGLVTIWDAKTESGTRGVPMTARVREILERRCLALKHGRVFPYTQAVLGNTWGSLRKALGLTKDKDFVPYCCRHTFATRLVQRGVRIEVIQKLLGHASLTQTMQYAHLGAHQFVDAIKALEAAQ